jgi:hypothetical protein
LATHFVSYVRTTRLISFLLVLLIVVAPPLFPEAVQAAIGANDLKLLKKIQQDSFNYFVHYTDSNTGLTSDSSRPGSPASIAATGFALASFGIATTHGWISYKEAYQRIEIALKTLLKKNTNKNGFYYHFLDSRTAKRIWDSEASSIDTALLIAGALLAASYFPGTNVEKLAQKLYEEVKWPWMLNDSLLFAHGWKPNQGFLPYHWDMYAEHLILQVLAMGSPTYPAPEAAWSSWERKTDTYNNKKIVYSYSGSLFTYQYSHMFIDFRKINDGNVNYFQNSQNASHANSEFCSTYADKYATYENGVWGLSASLGPDGYRAYGAEPGEAYHDGTIAPHGAIGSIQFTPEASMTAIRNMYLNYGDRIYGSIGFQSAFNLDRNWWASESLGIDQGLIVLALENFLNHESVWKRFMRLKSVQRWIERADLNKGSISS